MEWISVEDRLPETEGTYIVYFCVDEFAKIVGVAHWHIYPERRWFTTSGTNLAGTITHWMPLPAPPEEK